MNETLQNEKTYSKKQLRNIALGAAFLAATTNIGPGFLTQTATFTGQYLGGFLFIIAFVALFDIVCQGTIYRMCCYTGKYTADIANDLKHGLGYFLSILIMIGMFVYQLGNVSGVALGIRTLFNLDGYSASISILIAGAICILVFCYKKFNPIIDTMTKVLAVLMIISTVIIAVITKPPLGNVVSEFAELPKATLIFPFMTLLGGASGGYSCVIGAHRLLGRGLKGESDYPVYKSTLKAHMGTVYLMRFLIFAAVYGVVAAGAVLDPSDPARSAFQAGAGLFGRYIFGVVMFAAGLSTVVGAAVTLTSMLSVFVPKIKEKERSVAIIYIAIATVAMATIGQPAAMLVAAGAFNGLVLPFTMAIMLVASRNKRIMGENYKHPLFYTIGGVIVIFLMGYFGITNFTNIFSLFA